MTDFGVVEWFEVGEHERVEKVLTSLRAMGVRRLRTGLSWADWYTDEGEAWYDWLIPTLAREVEVLPCYLYTPPSIGVVPKTSSPPRRPREYADVLDLILDRYGEHFEYVELWNEPNNLSEWDWTLDPGWATFSRMIIDAANWARQRGKKTVLGGMSPVDPSWLELMWDRGVIDHIDAIGIHGFPGTWEATWQGWDDVVDRVRRVFEGRPSNPQLWVTEVGYSTWLHDELGQARGFLNAIDADMDRVYWYSAQDLDPARPTVDGFHSDEREYHFGLRRSDGSPKLLGRMLEGGGVPAVREITARVAPAVHTKSRGYALITGGCGFLGTNLADRLLRDGQRVRLLDNLSRPGVEQNLRTLQERYDRVDATIGDVRNPYLVKEEVEGADRVFHLAAQVAVTTSVEAPSQDFEVNARGTLNVLDAIRDRDDRPPLVFTSTNKVYGGLDDVELRVRDRRYEPVDTEIRSRGIGEERCLQFLSPYGCSKGAADQYVLDHAHTFGLPAAVLRLSCVYGPHQLGTEDQGWVAHFLIRALEGKPVTIFGDGLQVRDILFVTDLVNLFLRAAERIDDVRGRPLNVGGGGPRAVSLLELLEMFESMGIPRPEIQFEEPRPGDQRYYVSDLRHAERILDWSPTVEVEEGLRLLHAWQAGFKGGKGSRTTSVPGSSGRRVVERVKAGGHR